MGQYYKPMNLDKRETLSSHAYDSGAKLTEHSWLANDFVGVVVKLLQKEWKGNRIAWIGDYYEKENPNVRDTWEDLGNADKPKSTDYKVIKPPKSVLNKGFINNLDKEISIDLSKCYATEDGDPEWVMHPLPLLTACGNGKGGGDYRHCEEGDDIEPLIGIWAGDRLSYTPKKAAYKDRLKWGAPPNSIDFIDKSSEG